MILATFHAWWKQSFSLRLKMWHTGSVIYSAIILINLSWTLSNLDCLSFSTLYIHFTLVSHTSSLSQGMKVVKFFCFCVSTTFLITFEVTVLNLYSQIDLYALWNNPQPRLHYFSFSFYCQLWLLKLTRLDMATEENPLALV